MEVEPPRFSPRDIVSGVSVALVLIPQALAYAELAGVPAHVGLFAAGLPLIVAGFLASSRYLQTGPVAMTALLTFGALQSVGLEPQSDKWVAMAALLALMVGVIRLLLGAFRGGAIAYLLSQPVLNGFTSAAALIIIASQLPTALGVAKGGNSILAEAGRAATEVAAWDREAVVLSLATATIILGGRRLHKLFPGVLVAAIAALAAGSAGFGGPKIGDVPTGLPSLVLDLPWGSTTDLIVPALVVALIGFAEPASIARTFAAADRTPWDADRELVAQGAANVTSGLFGGFPVGGSFGRTAVAKLAGARSRWSGAVTGLVVLIFIPAAGILSELPRAFLGATVIAGTLPLARPDRIAAVARRSKPQGLIGAVTFVSTLLLTPRIDQGVLLGIVTAVVVHLWRELRTEVAVEAREDHLVMKPHGVLFFASTPHLEDQMVSALAAHPDASVLEIDLSGLGRIDYTGAMALRALCNDALDAGLSVQVSHVPPQSERIVGSVVCDEPGVERV